jgi:lipoate---protein ligase
MKSAGNISAEHSGGTPLAPRPPAAADIAARCRSGEGGTARPSVGTEQWRLLPFSRAASSRHVALSDVLARFATEPSVWWHAAERPTLLLGAGQSEHGIGASPIGITRRHSGGTAVLATPNVLGLDVLLPRGHRLAIPDVVEGYRWFGECWAETVRRLGLDAHVVGVAEARAAPAPPADLATAVRLACFGTLSPYEVVVGGRKLIGLAQVRRRNVVLQSGLHFTFDAAALARRLAPERAPELARELSLRATGLAESGLPSVGTEQVIDTFALVLHDLQNVSLVPGEWTETDAL